MNGSSRLDVELKMNLKNRRRNPTLTITHNSTQGHVSTALGQLLDRRLVHFTFFSRQVLDTGCRVLSKSSFVVVYYHRRELPQISFLSRQNFCHDKHMSRQKCACCDKSSVAKKMMFVAKQIFCHDKTLVMTNIRHDKHHFVATKFMSRQAYKLCLSQQHYVCCNKHYFVPTNIILL